MVGGGWWGEKYGGSEYICVFSLQFFSFFLFIKKGSEGVGMRCRRRHGCVGGDTDTLGMKATTTLQHGREAG